ncbi:phosphoribosylformylglycinamidine synthase subunit PurL [Calditerrivibrio nitroreducens]|uniref:Phosphoribosylformylglycinamidine synthase subunit PurL n=1 Tax=Calditerrivibrio nitroreducens (strain DSM 19672 / NBRC 101217 / Yu37-1) TaxID=768670 RepID=E4TI51_CALNY|nr:phosphoribosylformylglycinamidine synthase subunit PurL [Calditerrivibrio nitroreducens]ADR18967.1 phosphoribosylformylglycinamidine synthase subunit II [Calditerrivibrio nitroreducens DSM 19672]
MSVYNKFKFPKVTVDVAVEMGLKPEEFEKAREILGRTPNYIELGIISAMWSEHCSYKSSKIHLKKFPTSAPWVVQGPGENAGIIEIDGDICACFKVESHNHPSYIEPYQGAATGVGGILRDVFTMGARPVAAMNSLRFGKLDNNETKHILEGVVAGIAGYGNCFGVPTIGGEVFFHESYQKNPLVNAFALGIVKKDKIFYAKAEGVGNVIIYVGAKTGRDGIHGATMASEEFSSDDTSKRPNVQIGDPFKEKLLLEACLELMQEDYIVGIQDMGAAGLTSSSFEMASRAGSGVKLYLDKVPVREKDMNPYEIMLSESQERMLIVAKKGFEKKIKKIFDKWDLDAEVIGEVTDDGFVRLFWDGEEVAALKAAPLSDEAPVYDRPYQKPSYMDELKKFDINSIPEPKNYNDVLMKIFESPNIASKEYIYEQYDHMVQTNTVVLPGSDASVIRVKGSKKCISISSDCNGRYCYLDSFMGGMQAVVEACRNVAMSGARPLAITDCLNFGNPEKPEIMWQFVNAVEGMASACKRLNTPVVSGNVSFYNETDGNAIFPTPTVVAVGVIDDVDYIITSDFKNLENYIYLVGSNRGEIGGGEYLNFIHNTVAGKIPEVDLYYEKDLVDFMVDAAKKKIIKAAHDVSEGGLVVALSEMTFKNDIGFEVYLKGDIRPDFYMFSESQGMVILEVEKINAREVEKLLKYYSLPFSRIGETTGRNIVVNYNKKNIINLPLDIPKYIYKTLIKRVMG